MNWDRWPNLSRRPRAPNAGRGRLQRAVARAFLVHGPEITSSQAYDFAFPGRRKVKSELLRYGVWCVLMTVADPIRKVPPYGAWLWRLRNTDKKPE
jgi:hypothetical protein